MLEQDNLPARQDQNAIRGSNLKSAAGLSQATRDKPALSTPAHAFACPHCGQATISIVKKLFIGPIPKFSCPACGGKLRTSWRSIALLVAGIVGIVTISFAGLFIADVDLTPEGAAVVGIVGFTIAMWAFLRFAPVEKAQRVATGDQP